MLEIKVELCYNKKVERKEVEEVEKERKREREKEEYGRKGIKRENKIGQKIKVR